MSNQLKYIVYGLLALITLAIAFVVYRMFFMFDMKEASVYINEEAAKYSDKAAAYSIIMDGVEHILASHNLTQQVLRSAKASGTDREQELVNASVNLCKALRYLDPKATDK